MKLGVFIISLASSERWSLIEGNFAGLGLDATLFEAFDARQLDKSEVGALIDSRLVAKHMGRELANAEVGCALSHLNLYKKIQSEQIDLALVMEDDALPNIDIDCVIGDFLALAKGRPTVLSLFSGDAYCVKTSIQGCLRCLTPPTHTVAYVINRQGAEVFLRSTEGKVTATADWPPVDGVSFFITENPMVEHQSAGSSIKSERDKLAAPTFGHMLLSVMSLQRSYRWLLMQIIKRRFFKLAAPFRVGITHIRHQDT